MAIDYSDELEKELEHDMLQRRLLENEETAKQMNKLNRASALQYVLPGAIGGGIGGGALGYGAAKGLAKRQAVKTAMARTGGLDAGKAALEEHFGKELARAVTQKQIDKTVNAWNIAENALIKRNAIGQAQLATQAMMTPAQMLIPLTAASSGAGIGSSLGYMFHKMRDRTSLDEAAID